MCIEILLGRIHEHTLTHTHQPNQHQLIAPEICGDVYFAIQIYSIQIDWLLLLSIRHFGGSLCVFSRQIGTKRLNTHARTHSHTGMVVFGRPEQLYDSMHTKIHIIGKREF